jgi:hypothetical protein
MAYLCVLSVWLLCVCVQDPGKVFKGKKMAGRWGVERVTIQNVRVHKIDVWNELLFLQGCVPGVSGMFMPPSPPPSAIPSHDESHLIGSHDASHCAFLRHCHT